MQRCPESLTVDLQFKASFDDEVSAKLSWAT